ncbi:MAG: Invasin [Candidatus Erwinia impunctatus]|nr:Invasin [Culicoides impunctatus]
MRCQTVSYQTKILRITAYLLLWFQVLSPLFVTVTSVARATQEHEAMSEMLDTMNGLQILTASPSTPAGGATSLSPAPVINSVAPPVMLHPLLAPGGIVRTPESSAADSSLPALGSPENSTTPTVTLDALFAQGVSQTARILSTENATESSIQYARGLGENLINQQINDWLSQYGHARMQFGSNKTGDADLLLPLIDTPNSLFFSQQGLRANEDRTIVNLGLGYRQYQNGWMWGVNSFYDYDLTGSNARAGVGGELWADYLKLAANGYFRLTDWHQSTLSSMRDYDERPANGFDVRVEGYLPGFPQLGAFAKYEQYFGKGIDLQNGTSPDDLKKDPSATTVGVTYTPFPLLTFKGQTTHGDAAESYIGVELNYRMGMSFASHLDPANVDLMRSLAGNRYDFVDRNYNIVMQYRKQDLLKISLPARMSGEAAQTLPVTLAVNKAKYGLSSVNWSAPELIANGGKLVVTTPTTLLLTLPAYNFANGDTGPQSYRLTATGTDNKGNASNTAEMWIDVRISQEQVISLDLAMETARRARGLQRSAVTLPVANDVDKILATAIVANDKNEMLADRELTFRIDGFSRNEHVTLSDNAGNRSTGSLALITDTDGKAALGITSKIAGKGLLTVTMRNGNSRTSELIFQADSRSAGVENLVLTKNRALANNQAVNAALVTVSDQFGNPVPGMVVQARASEGSSVVTPQMTTNELGQATFEFSSVRAGDATLTVSVNGSERDVTGQFIADISTARVVSAEVVSNHAVVSLGGSGNQVKVKVVDAQGNSLSGAPVEVRLPGSDGSSGASPLNGLSGEDGTVVAH